MEIHRQDEFGERDSLIDSMFALEEKRQEKKLLSYIPSFFTTASLPFRNVKSPVFVRRGSNGVTLRLTAPRNVPFGKYGRLLLSLLTTHAVLSREKDCQVEIRYEKLGDMLRELELPKSRGREIREQLECFRAAGYCGEVVVNAEYGFQCHPIDDIVIYSYYTAAFAYGVIHGIGSSFFLIYVYSILILAKIMVDFYIYAKSGRNMPKVVK